MRLRPAVPQAWTLVKMLVASCVEKELAGERVPRAGPRVMRVSLVLELGDLVGDGVASQ